VNEALVMGSKNGEDHRLLIFRESLDCLQHMRQFALLVWFVLQAFADYLCNVNKQVVDSLLAAALMLPEMNDCESIKHLSQRVFEDFPDIIATLDTFAADRNHIMWQIGCHKILKQVKDLDFQRDRYILEESQQGLNVLGLSDVMQLLLSLR